MFDVGGGQWSKCWLAENGGRLPVLQPTTDVPAAELAAVDGDDGDVAAAPDRIGEALDAVGPGAGVAGGSTRNPDVPG